MIASHKERTHSNFAVIWLVLGMLFIACSDQDDKIAVLPVQEYPERKQDFSLWQLEQFGGESQMGYILRTDDGHVIVVDGGRPVAAEFLEDYLVQLGGSVDMWLTTHPHIDHIGALDKIIQDSRFTIKSIVQSTIDEELVRLHEPQSYELVKEYYQNLKRSDIPILDASQGDVFSLGDGVKLKILGDRNEKILVNLVNNSSLVFKISSKTKSVLFLGDLGVEGGNEILKSFGPEDLQADYVQMAHHGQDGVDKLFYQQVNATNALWPTPIWLWENNLDAKGYNTGTWKTLAVRRWVEELHIKNNFVSGIEGTQQID
jgi:glyoxylase-like metal-dependent hydrolase (beta-lactamase superfamily II)